MEISEDAQFSDFFRNKEKEDEYCKARALSLMRELEREGRWQHNVIWGFTQAVFEEAECRGIVYLKEYSEFMRDHAQRYIDGMDGILDRIAEEMDREIH